jgi:hypothetical protein
MYTERTRNQTLGDPSDLHIADMREVGKAARPIPA